MSNYSRLNSFAALLPATPVYADYGVAIVPYLVDQWLSSYRIHAAVDEVVEVHTGNFHYLFDVLAECLIAAWGVSMGKHGEPRPASRMAGHPLSNGPLYHRGHAIPHTLGGGTDINLVPQLAKVNVGPFRKLEKRAVAMPGSFYFTNWIYSTGNDQTPTGVEQGFVCAGMRPEIIRHGN